MKKLKDEIYEIIGQIDDLNKQIDELVEKRYEIQYVISKDLLAKYLLADGFLSKSTWKIGNCGTATIRIFADDCLFDDKILSAYFRSSFVVLDNIIIVVAQNAIIEFDNISIAEQFICKHNLTVIGFAEQIKIHELRQEIIDLELAQKQIISNTDISVKV